jgi:hypothetical protein
MRVMSSLVYARILPTASVTRVVVCAWRRPAVVGPTTSSSSVAVIARAQVLSAGSRRHWLIVVGVWARCLGLGHHCGSLAMCQCLFLCNAAGSQTCSGSAWAGSLSGLKPLLYAIMGDVKGDLRKTRVWDVVGI